MALHEDIERKQLSELTPDIRNPRFPKSVREGLADADQAFDHLADAFASLDLAESIARHGYFVSEPMIITEEEGQWVVLEGNRRLTALHGLARPELRANFDSPERWDEAAAQAQVSLDYEVPVLIADEREDADQVIGFRHIGGILAWSPVQRAQFIAHLIDERGESFMDTAEAVGEEESMVRLLYRNQAIITAAEDLGGEEIASRATKRFGIFTSALNRTTLRDFVGANPVSEVEERCDQLSADRLPHLEELSSWLFGSNGDAKVIRESREIKQLAQVVAHDDALEELRRTRNLESALDIAQQVDDPDPAKVMRALATGVGHVRTASASIELIAVEPRTAELSEELDELAEQIHDAVERAEE